MGREECRNILSAMSCGEKERAVWAGGSEKVSLTGSVGKGNWRLHQSEF